MTEFGKYKRGAIVLDKDGVPITGQDAGENRPLHVLVLDSAGTAISSFGGTQYEDGDAASPVQGTAIMFDNDPGGGGELRTPSTDYRLPTTTESETPEGGTVSAVSVVGGVGAGLLPAYAVQMDTLDGDGVTAITSERAFKTQAHLHGYNGTTWDRLRSDIANGLDVDVTRLPPLPAGTNTIGTVNIQGPASGGWLEPYSEDFDTGGGIDTVSSFGIAVPASGGPGVVNGDETYGLDVDVTRSALPTGAATSANQDTANTDLSSIRVALQVMDDWDDGSDHCRVVGDVDVTTTDGYALSDVKHSAIATINSTTAVNVIAAAASKRYRILSLTITNVNTSTSCYIEFSIDNGSTYYHRMQLVPEFSIVRHFQAFETDTANEAFKARLSGACASVYVTAEYVEIT